MGNNTIFHPFKTEHASYKFPQMPSIVTAGDKVAMNALIGPGKIKQHILHFYLCNHVLAPVDSPDPNNNFACLASLDPIEFMRRYEAFCVNGEDDSGFENGLVLSAFLTEIRDSAVRSVRAFILNPSATLIDALRQEQFPLDCQLTICTASNEAAEIYRMDNRLHMFEITSLEDLPKKLHFTHALFFATDSLRKKLVDTLGKFIPSDSKESDPLHLILPVNFFTGKLRTHLCKHLPLEHVLVIAQKATASQHMPKAILSYGAETDQIAIQRADLSPRKASLITSSALPVSRKFLWSSTKTLHQIYDDLYRASILPNLPKELPRHRVSPHVQLVYREEKRPKNKFRIVAYYKSVGDKEQRRKNLSGQGTALFQPLPSHEMKKETEIKPYLDDLIWSEEAREKIKSDIEKNVAPRERDLLTLWYLYRKDLLTVAEYNDQFCAKHFKELAAHPDLALFGWSLDKHEMSIQEALKEFARELNLTSRVQNRLTKQLRIVSKRAFMEKTWDRDPLDELLAERETKKKVRGEMRRQTVLRAIEAPCLKRLEEFLEEKKDPMLNAIIALKLHLGLETTVIGALAISDVVPKVQHMDFPAICITKRLSPTENTPEAFSSVEKNRVIPIPEEAIDALLDYYKDALKAAVATGVEKPKELPLFPKLNCPQERLSKNEINKLVKSAKEAMKIEAEAHFIPDGQRLVEEDLNHYGGDIFRAFYDLRVRDVTLFRDDAAYLYGTKLHSVSCSHYRDYLYPCTQLSLHQLQNRCAQFRDRNTEAVDPTPVEIRLARGLNKPVHVNTSSLRTKTTITLDIPADPNLDLLKVSIQCRYGMDVTTTFQPNTKKGEK